MNTATPHTPARVEPRAHPPVITARSLVYSYDRTPALRGISLEVGRGEILAVTGASGSGKSTLLLCLAGVLVPDAGEVGFGDQPIGTASEAARSRLRRTRFGVLFQFGQLVPELTAVENVALPLLLAGRRRAAAVTAASSATGRSLVPAVMMSTVPFPASGADIPARCTVRARSFTLASPNRSRSNARTPASARVTRNPSPRAARRSAIATTWSGVFPGA